MQNQGTYQSLELLLQSVEKDMLPKAVLSPAELLFSLAMDGVGHDQTPDSGTSVWVLEAEGMNP